MQTYTFTFLGQTLQLHPLKGIFWEEANMLLLADLHLGKAIHFRKAGIPVPRAAGDANWDRLIYLLLEFKPQRVLFLGDLFHSHVNQQWPEFVDLMSRFSDIQFELVQGNHDILPDEYYQEANLIVYDQALPLAPFFMSHHPIKSPPDNLYNLAGHIHPCVWLKGQGRQKLKLPCFYFGKNGAILPAFGTFTGTAKIAVQKEDQVFVIADEMVVNIE